MSMNALRWAREPRPGLGITATAVLRDLADRANDTGVCWPSLRTIIADTGACERSVRNALRRLEEEELLRVHHIAGRSSRYVLSIPRHDLPDTPAPDAAPPAPDAPNASISHYEAKPWAAPAAKPNDNA